MTPEQRLEQLFRDKHGLITRTDALQAGVHPRHLSGWLQAGRVERVQPGIYRLIEAEPFTHEELLEIALRAPRGVVCLLSAASFHDLSTTVPSQVFLALPPKAWRPQIEFPPVRYYHFSGTAYSFGIEAHQVGPGTVRVYSAEKTVADLLRYRGKLGNNLFLESLKTYLRRRGSTVERLLDAARACRVEGLMRDYATTVLA